MHSEKMQSVHCVMTNISCSFVLRIVQNKKQACGYMLAFYLLNISQLIKMFVLFYAKSFILSSVWICLLIECTFVHRFMIYIYMGTSLSCTCVLLVCE